MDGQARTVCVILAGGQGKRMASTARHKVCFPILGVPAIVRAVDVYKAAGLRHFIIIVGQMADQVIATVADAHPDVSFVYQGRPKGTGHAASIAASALEAQGFDGNVMVVMGDKVTHPKVVRRLLERFDRTGADVIMTTVPKLRGSTAGRVVVDRAGQILGEVELPDIQEARRKHKKLRLGGRWFTAAQIERLSREVNISMYIFRFEPLREALKLLRANNVQGELYLTDTVEHIARTGRVGTMLLEDSCELMAFNTPQELMSVEEVLAKRKKPSRVSVVSKKRLSRRVYRPGQQWLKLLHSDPPKLRRLMQRIYGADESLHADRRRAMVRLVREFIRRFGKDRSMVLCRAPGRINLMGRHVDHRGGDVNVMAINREMLLAAGVRGDDSITLNNLQPRRFPPRQFRIYELVRGFSWSDWMEFLGSKAAQSVIQAAPGDWSHYARAPLLRMQHEARGVHLKGMDCLVDGNIPMGAGLSSSSAIVEAFAEAALALNGLDMTTRDFIDLCGEGEWFVESPGARADHAAIRSSTAGYISHMAFFPFHKADQVRFPPQMSLAIAHSGSRAVKSGAARDTYNQRLACYQIAQMLLRRSWPAAAGVEHLRDLAPDRLKVRPGEIYRALMLLPNRPSRRRLRQLAHPDDADRLEQIFTTHANLGGYNLRGIALYGISECLRSSQFARTIKQGDYDRLGRFMRASHDGDRIVRYDAKARRHKHIVRTDDATLGGLAATDADLATQSGRYACSTGSIDRLVDIADSIEGVIGSQLAGAGLGGCVMILLRTESLGRLMSQLRKRFYTPRGLKFDVHICKPVAGAGLLEL